MDPDPGGTKTCGSGLGSGTATLGWRIVRRWKIMRASRAMRGWRMDDEWAEDKM